MRIILALMAITFISCERNPCYDCREVITTFDNGDIEIKEVCIEIDCTTI